MKLVMKSAIAAVVFSFAGAGAALAAEECCCKGKDGKMACCEKMAAEHKGHHDKQHEKHRETPPKPQGAPQTPQSEHQH